MAVGRIQAFEHALRQVRDKKHVRHRPPQDQAEQPADGAGLGRIVEFVVQQLAGIHSKRPRDAGQPGEGWHSGSPLEPADGLDGNAGPLCELCLCHTEATTTCRDRVPKMPVRLVHEATSDHTSSRRPDSRDRTKDDGLTLDVARRKTPCVLLHGRDRH